MEKQEFLDAVSKINARIAHLTNMQKNITSVLERVLQTGVPVNTSKGTGDMGHGVTISTGEAPIELEWQIQDIRETVALLNELRGVITDMYVELMPPKKEPSIIDKAKKAAVRIKKVVVEEFK